MVAAEKENQPPVALDDNVLVQPNRMISYNVLGNDVDPDDDPLRIAQSNSTVKGAKHENGFIEVPVGDAPDSGAAATNVGYTIEDAAGARDNAVLKVRASKDAPFYAPIANDDVAEYQRDHRPRPGRDRQGAGARQRPRLRRGQGRPQGHQAAMQVTVATARWSTTTPRSRSGSRRRTRSCSTASTTPTTSPRGPSGSSS
ncbi:hypothetical protein G5V59_07845 [Nocardioides sp. W3-2-3]|uniref:Ig-like domain-containing protein n=1 Tax=Nocardioides convexus TaxID=2712224 RepID=UPI002418B5FA|nr:Ig-like domain-containing protein [Nocardioides convexus]NHA00107.1 hypothetical protein [Nocardioides convexus]